MTTPTVKSEYITKQDFNKAIDDLKESIEGLSGNVDRRIAHLKNDVLENAKKHTDEAIKSERESREKAQAQLSDDIESISEKVDSADAHLSRIESNLDTRLDTVGTMISGIDKAVSRLDGTLSSWKSAMDATAKTADNQTLRLQQAEKTAKELRENIDSVSVRVEKNANGQGRLNRSIYGDGEDGPDSIFKILQKLEASMSKGFGEQAGQLTDINKMVEANVLSIAVIQNERQKEQQKWQQRKDMAQQATMSLLQNKSFIGFMFFLVSSIVLGFSPDAREGLVELLTIVLAIE